MKRSSIRISVVISLMLMMGAFAVSSFGQATKKKPEVAVKIQKFTGIGSRALVETPYYNTSFSKTVRQPRKWAEIKTVYRFEAAPEWVDGLTFEYFVISAKVNERTKKTEYTLFKKLVSCRDIERGSSTATEHMSAVHLHPAGVKRFGEIVAVGVLVTWNGIKLDYAVDYGRDKNFEPYKKQKARFWEKDEIMSKVNEVGGYLLDRSESPFIHVNEDSFERIK